MKKRTLSLFLFAVSIVLIGCDIKVSVNLNSEIIEPHEQEITYGYGTDVVSLDPAVVTDEESFKVARNVYETLVKFGENDVTIEPLLAKSWTISEDGTTYTFELQEGVTFHDGAQLTASSVVANFERWMGGKGNDYPYYRAMFGGYKNQESHLIDYVAAPEKYRFVLKLKSPNAALLNNLAMTAFSIASPAKFEKERATLGRKPVGTGPFSLEKWKKSERVTLIRNENYWQEGVPKVAKLHYKTIPDAKKRVQALIDGDIDIADGVTNNYIKQVEDNKHSNLMERSSFNVSFLAMTLTRRPLGDTKIREAISYAINREAILKNSFNSKAIIAKNPMQPTSFAYNEETKAYEYNVEKAKQLLRASTYDGSTIELWTMDVPRPYMPDGMAAAKQIQQDLQAIGLNTKIITHDWQTYLEKTTNGEAQLFLLGGTSDNGDPDNLLSLFFEKTGALNKTRLDDKKIQNWLKLARETTDENERKEYYQNVQDRLRELIPLVPLVHSTPVLGVSESIQNYVPHPTGSDDFSNVSKN